ncbi:MAG: potassium channel family protein [Alphaproteobacteria bacterium]|nr:potassium channel family protein [Alphaproteobacteria bacterium]
MGDARPQTLKSRVNRLYHGKTPAARRFRYGLVAFDLVTISFFIVTSFAHHAPWLIPIDVAIGGVLLLDLFARVWIARDRLKFFLTVHTLVDVIVILTLLLPLFLQNMAFLRILRALRLLRSYHVLRDLRDEFTFFAAHEEVIQSVVNLFVFIFFITALVYVFQADVNEDINSYLDALYFTVTTLTTTGFGDITLHGDSGHILSVVIMVVGVSLFLRLVQTIFRPAKVRHECSACGLNRHDPDAVHCKHCGTVLHIETEGE